MYDSEPPSNKPLPIEEDWKWQLQNRLTTREQIEKYLVLTDDEKSGFDCNFPVAITPYVLSLIDKNDPMDPIKKQFLPSGKENIISPIEMDDPCGEDHDSPVPGLVHRYPDRVLFLACSSCSNYCRFCTRSRLVGEKDKIPFESNTEKKLDYIRAHTEVRDVLISGGDPLLLSTDKLESILKAIRAIEHVEIIRIGTRAPIVLPQRIDKELCDMLEKYHPLLISVHVNNAKELTPRSKQVTDMLLKAGIPLGSQTVLLKDINDTPEEMKKLMHKLIKNRIRPYYLYQCDPVFGSGHLRTSVKTGMQIMKELRGHTSGYCIPTYVIDAPGGGGKTPIEPNHVISTNDEKTVIKNWEEKIYEYRE